MLKAEKLQHFDATFLLCWHLATTTTTHTHTQKQIHICMYVSMEHNFITLQIRSCKHTHLHIHIHTYTQTFHSLPAYKIAHNSLAVIQSASNSKVCCHSATPLSGCLFVCWLCFHVAQCVIATNVERLIRRHRHRHHCRRCSFSDLESYICTFIAVAIV